MALFHKPGLQSPPSIVITIIFLATFVSTFGASITVGSASTIATHFGAPHGQKPFLISAYLLGCAFGPLFFAPLSEYYGRRWCMILGAGVVATFTCAGVGAPNWAALLAFRFLAGAGSTAAMCVSGGIIADILPGATARGLVSTWLMVATTLGPLVASTCSIFVGNRWPGRWEISFWINGGAALLAFLAVWCLPETLHEATTTPVEQEEGPTTADRSSSLATAPSSTQKHVSAGLLSHLSVPFRMLAFEPIVSVTCLFLSLIYAIFYLFFQLLPVLFTERYAFSKESRAVIFVPVAVGAVLAGLVYSILEGWLRRLAENSERWGTDRTPELRRLPPACCGSLLCVLSLFLAGYAVSRPTAHYAYLLVLEGAFGTGFLLIFIGLTNYLVDAYKTAVVSALAPSFVFRNLVGASFQFAARPIYSDLGAKWELYLLGLLTLPFACLITGTLWYGPWLRSRSKIVQSMQ